METIRVKQAIHNIIKRAERVDMQTAVETFYDSDIISHLENRNHEIIQGKRGTGKTHTLYVLKHKLEKKNQHCFLFDCKKVGNATTRPKHEISVEDRAIGIVQDFLTDFHQDLLQYFSDFLFFDNDERKDWLEILLDKLFEFGTDSENANRKYEQTRGHTVKTGKSENNSHSVSLFPLATAFSSSGNRQQEGEATNMISETGETYDKIRFPAVFDCINQIATTTKTEFVILIDEWSHLPLDIQPHFAEFVQCCLIPSSHVTVKIASVSGMTNYCIRDQSGTYGLELKDDITVAVDFDTRYTFDRDPKATCENLYNILLAHLKAKNVVPDINLSKLENLLFKDERSSILLARAAEGNPRDFISILGMCISEIGAIEESRKIDTHIICRASMEWYEREKVETLLPLQKKFLSEITRYIVEVKHSRGFAVNKDYLLHPAFKVLIDARVLHVIHTKVQVTNLSDNDLAIIVLDFGLYANKLMTNYDIHFLQDDPYETAIFGKLNERDRYNLNLYPFDEHRWFQLNYIDPELNGRNYPSFPQVTY